LFKKNFSFEGLLISLLFKACRCLIYKSRDDTCLQRL